MSFQQFFVTEGNWECEVNIENNGSNTAKCKKRFNLLDYVEQISTENDDAIWINKEIKLLLDDYRTKLKLWRPWQNELRPFMTRNDNEITMSYELSERAYEHNYTIIDNQLQHPTEFQNQLSLWLETTLEYAEQNLTRAERKLRGYV